MLWKAGLVGERGAHCTRAAMRFLRHEGQFLSDTGSPLSFQAQVRAQDGSLPHPGRHWVHVMGCLFPPSLDVMAPSSSLGRRDASAAPAEARLPVDGKGGDGKGGQEHQPGYPSRTAQ